MGSITTLFHVIYLSLLLFHVSCSSAPAVIDLHNIFLTSHSRWAVTQSQVMGGSGGRFGMAVVKYVTLRLMFMRATKSSYTDQIFCRYMEVSCYLIHLVVFIISTQFNVI